MKAPLTGLGLRTKVEGGALKLAHVLDGGSAQSAGLSAGDELVAMNGLRVTVANLDALLARCAPGDVLDLQAFRRDELLRFALELRAPAMEECALKITERVPSGSDALREGWLGR